jgi:hypothetical protein
MNLEENMDWQKIIWAILIGAMIIMLLPRAKAMFAESKKADPGAWSSALLPLALVVGFVILLIISVR